MRLTLPLDERALEGSTINDGRNPLYDGRKPPDDSRKLLAVNGPRAVPLSSIRFGTAIEGVRAHRYYGATSIGSLS